MNHSLEQPHNSLSWPPEAYQLLDFGDGRKLERFGDLILDRPSPAALESQPHSPTTWHSADVRLSQAGRVLASASNLPTTWTIQHQWLCLQLRLTAFGHVGIFPEHAHHWPWLLEHEATPDFSISVLPKPHVECRRVLNLFAYTGSTTLVLAHAGWHVTHVDASAPSVAWARSNAQLSQLASAPIRWIVEDARTYAAREVRRGQRYDLIVLDPPSYGHGPKGQAWQIERDLDPLLEHCGELLAPAGRLLLTAHNDSSLEIHSRLPELLAKRTRKLDRVETGRMSLHDTANRTLDCGWYARAHLL